MILGIDFDNTLACYDGLFYAEAYKSNLLPQTFIEKNVQDKNSVRDVLRSAGQEEAFTQLQGYVYGPGISEAKTYPDVLSSLKILRNQDIELYIISHKTPFPYLGPKYNLHEYARKWLDAQGFFDDNLVNPKNVFFEKTKENKLARINSQKCTHFVDDLPEILEHPLFPTNVVPLLFCPEQNIVSSMTSFASWQDLTKFLVSV